MAVHYWLLAIGLPSATRPCSASVIQTSLITLGLIAALAIGKVDSREIKEISEFKEIFPKFANFLNFPKLSVPRSRSA